MHCIIFQLNCNTSHLPHTTDKICTNMHTMHFNGENENSFLKEACLNALQAIYKMYHICMLTCAL